MGLGRRSAPSAPPIPTRPLPPSAYGIALRDAPAPEQWSPVSDTGQFAWTPPPPPLPPQHAAPPANPYAPPGAMSPAPALAPGQWVPTGVPHRVPPVARVIIALVAVFLAMALAAAVAIPSFLAQRSHHIGVLPAAVGDAVRQSGSAVDAAVAKATSANPSGRHHIDNLQFGVYGNGSSTLTVEIGQVAAPYASGTESGTGRDVDAFFDGMSESAGSDLSVPFHAVDNGSWTGATRCAAVTSTTPICAWVDNGTVGLVVLRGGDEAGALAYLHDLRGATERL